ncbi:hypothetical protein [Polaromonas sp.]|uniref:hypothetical protein n=1 Tax=Polaromonas sp. TaxID=1869339 RepID=UPI00182728DC|nr:hypothetical protein [Polaromonas sp.]NMM06343.1 hypothetical protein [Polaromonas sp.]
MTKFSIFLSSIFNASARLINLEIFNTSSEDARGTFYYGPIHSFFTFGYIKTGPGESQAWGFGRHFIISRLWLSLR